MSRGAPATGEITLTWPGWQVNQSLSPFSLQEQQTCSESRSVVTSPHCKLPHQPCRCSCQPAGLLHLHWQRKSEGACQNVLISINNTRMKLSEISKASRVRTFELARKMSVDWLIVSGPFTHTHTHTHTRWRTAVLPRWTHRLTRHSD